MHCFTPLFDLFLSKNKKRKLKKFRNKWNIFLTIQRSDHVKVIPDQVYNDLSFLLLTRPLEKDSFTSLSHDYPNCISLTYRFCNNCDIFHHYQFLTIYHNCRFYCVNCFLSGI